MNYVFLRYRGLLSLLRSRLGVLWCDPDVDLDSVSVDFHESDSEFVFLFCFVGFVDCDVFLDDGDEVDVLCQHIKCTFTVY